MKLRKSKEQSARTKCIAKRINFPGWPLNFKMFKKSRHKIRYKIGSRASLNKDACQIWTYIIVDKMCSRLIYKWNRKNHLNPIIFLIERPLFSHQMTRFLSKTHRQKITDCCFFQILIWIFWNIVCECIGKLFIKRN